MLLSRFVNAAGVLLAVALITFWILGRAPGEFLDELAANPQVSRETLSEIRKHYGLDRPFYVKFWNWASSAARGDMGYSFVYQRPVRDLIAERIWNTVLLNACGLTCAWLLGLL